MRRFLRSSVVAIAAGVIVLSSAAQRRWLRVGAGIDGVGFGTSLVAAGDVDRDGRPDVLVGAAFDLRGGRDRGSVVLVSGADGRRIYRIGGGRPGATLGFAVARIRDANGDGLRDFAVGAPALSATGRGLVRVISAADGRTLATLQGNADADGFGFALADVGDLDRDGARDFAVSAPWSNSRSVRGGSVQVYSGKTLRRLWIAGGAQAQDQLGWSVAGVGDANGDGRGDLLVGTRVLGVRKGYALLLSGRDGKQIARFDGTGVADLFGTSVAAAGDLDRDGVSDLVVGAAASGVVRAFSGKTRRLLREWRVGSLPDLANHRLAGIGDIDGDRHGDLAFGLPLGGFPISGTVFLVSGKTGRIIDTVGRSGPGQDFGWSIAPLGDVDGDGVADLASGEPRGAVGRFQGGAVEVLSGRRLSLSADLHELSLADTPFGVHQRLTLSAGLAHAGEVYLLLGSASGTRPGFLVGGLRVPLNPDAWLTLTLGFPNTAVFDATLGVLDATGRGTARIRLHPALPASLAGTSLVHAYLTFRGLQPGFVSNVAPLRIVR